MARFFMAACLIHMNLYGITFMIVFFCFSQIQKMKSTFLSECILRTKDMWHYVIGLTFLKERFSLQGQFAHIIREILRPVNIVAEDIESAQHLCNSLETYSC